MLLLARYARSAAINGVPAKCNVTQLTTKNTSATEAMPSDVNVHSGVRIPCNMYMYYGSSILQLDVLISTLYMHV